MKVSLLDKDDRMAWNDFVAGHPHGHFMQSWEWGMLKEMGGWRASFLAIRDNERIVSGSLILSRRIPFLGKSVFYSPRGPLFDTNKPETLSILIDEVNARARSENAVFWRIDPYITEMTMEEKTLSFKAFGFKVLPLQWSYWNPSRYIMVLDLKGTPEDIFAKMNSGGRNEVRQAKKNGVTVRRAGESDMPAFAHIMGHTASKKGIPMREADYYARLYKTFNEGNRVAFFIAQKDERPASTGITINYGDKSWLMYLASNYEAKYSSRALQWEMVKWAVEQGCSTYDFRGSAAGYPPKETDKGYGVFKFKKSFGAELTVLAGYFDYIYSPALYPLVSLVEERVLPLGEKLMQSRFNPFVLRHKLKWKGGERR